MPEAGRLIVAATPIGNLGDLTLRVLDALKSADTVLAEDTRVTRKLFARYEITTPLERFDEHVAATRATSFVERMLAGESFVLVSDAGTPGVSDPGAQLIEACVESGVPVEALPGASAVLAALVASGMPMRRFYFGGFLPRKAGERTRLFESLDSLDATLVFFESPHRTAASLAALASTFPRRTGAMARELTKLHEEVVRGPLPQLAAEIAARETLKGEVVLLVAPPRADATDPPAPDLSPAELRARVDALVEQGVRRTDAVKRVAADTGMPRGVVYDAASG